MGFFVLSSRVGEGQQVGVELQDVWEDVDQSLSQELRHHAHVDNLPQLAENRHQVVVAERRLVAKQTLDYLHHVVRVGWKQESEWIQTSALGLLGSSLEAPTQTDSNTGWTTR